MARQATGKRYRKLAIARASGGNKIYHSKSVVKIKISGTRLVSSDASRPVVGCKKVFGTSGSAIDVSAIRQKFGVSQEELGRVTGYSTRSIAGWEGGQVLSDSARQKLIEAERLRAALAEIIPAGSLGDWLRTPNPAFEGQAPLQVIERGESDRLWRMIFQIDANVAS